MDKVNRIFDQLDDWRHLPTYQLERRADIFFSLYLREILQESTGEEIHEVIIPEFPLYQSALDAGKKDNRHYCADYLAFSRDMKQAFFIELKTDPNSSNSNQNYYLQQSKKVGLAKLLESSLSVFLPLEDKKPKKMNRQARKKRFHLLRKLEAIGLISGLEHAAEFIAREHHKGFTKAMSEARITPTDARISVACIHPNQIPSNKPDKKGVSEENSFDIWIPFKRALEVVKEHPDQLSQRFARSLNEWAEHAAGSRITL